MHEIPSLLEAHQFLELTLLSKFIIFLDIYLMLLLDFLGGLFLFFVFAINLRKFLCQG